MDPALARLVAESPPTWTADDSIRYAKQGYRAPVTTSGDLERVLALPRRARVDCRTGHGGPLSPVAAALVEVMNGRLRRPDWQRTDCRCRADFNRDCITSLLPAQAWALHEASVTGGVFGLLAVGSGKTGVGFLAPLVVPGVRLAVGLVPANLVEQLVREYLLWREHWRVPNLVFSGGGHFHRYERRPTLHVVSHQQLSQPGSTTLLRDLGPDLVYVDEADKFASLEAARTKRLVRQFDALPDTKFCGWTGTPWDASILECAHLAAFALGEGSPLPIDPAVAREWAGALDPGELPAAPGALRQLCTPGEPLREGFGRRLVETPGVVATQEGAIQIPLNLLDRAPPPIPLEVAVALDRVRGVVDDEDEDDEDVHWERPDGEELVDAKEVARVISQVACGFYYQWVFPRLPHGPDGFLTEEAAALVDDWRAKRKAWRRELRKKLMTSEPHLDSRALCERAALRYHARRGRAWARDRLARGRLAVPDLGDGGEENEDTEVAAEVPGLPEWRSETYEAWARVADRVEPETEAVWIDDYLTRDAAAWAREHRGVVWYKHVTFGERVAALSGLPRHGGGPGAEARILAERGETSIVASLDSHGRGRDGLQYLFHEQLVVWSPSSGRLYEQLLARLHRVGQPAPEVNSWSYRKLVPEWTEAFERALDRAEFARSTWGSAQKVLDARRGRR